MKADSSGSPTTIGSKKKGGLFEPDPTMLKKGWFIEFKNFLNDPNVKKVINIGGGVASAIAPFTEKPTVWNGLKAAFLTGKALVEGFEVWTHDYFDDEAEWVEPFPKDFTGAILKVLKKYPFETLKTAQEGTAIHLVTLPEGKVGWLTYSRSSFVVDRIYAQAAKVDVIYDSIKKMLWEQYAGKPLVLRRNAGFSLRTLNEDRIVLEVDDAFHPLPSELARIHTAYLKRAMDKGINRSVMLYGPPGTGKSTMARTLVNDLGLRSFRIRIEDVGGIDTNTLFEAINIFKPEALILDDFDRTGGQEQLLETLEHFARHIKLVIATVNQRSNFDEALLRPGRFDELILVKQMDDGVIKNALGENNLDIFDRVKEWPIAFIQEYVERCEFMSKTEAMKSLKELAERVERLSKYDDDDGDDSLVKILRKRKKNAGRKKPKREELSRSDVETLLQQAGGEVELPWDDSGDDDD